MSRHVLFNVSLVTPTALTLAALLCKLCIVYNRGGGVQQVYIHAAAAKSVAEEN